MTNCLSKMCFPYLVHVSVWQSTFQLKDSGGSGCTGWGLAMAGQPS